MTGEPKAHLVSDTFQLRDELMTAGESSVFPASAGAGLAAESEMGAEVAFVADSLAVSTGRRWFGRELQA